MATMDSDGLQGKGVLEGRVGWIDVLRIVVIFAVVWSHVCDDFIGQLDTDRSQFLTGVLLESIVRPAVPLFVLMTGWLLVPMRPTETMGGFYKKRISRLIPPLIFWSIVLPIVSYAYYVYVSPATQNPYVDIDAYTEESLVHKLWAWVLNFNVDTVPLWYLYMLIGLYLIIPVINSFLIAAKKRDIELLLILWAISTCLPYVYLLAAQVGNGYDARVWGLCDWNIVHPFYYVTGFVGYIVLAYYMKTYPPRLTWGKTLRIAIPLYVVGYAGTAGLYILMGEAWNYSYEYLEIPWTMYGVNIGMQTVAVLLVFMKLRVEPTRRLKHVAERMFGIFLCHFPVVQITYDWFDTAVLSPVVRIVAMSVTTFIICYCVTSILFGFKLTRRLVK